MSESRLSSLTAPALRRRRREIAVALGLAAALGMTGCRGRGDAGAGDRGETRRSALGVSAAEWFPAGPRATDFGGTRALNGFNGSTPIYSQLTAGAINAVVPHPSDVDTIYIGAVNGGVWRTHNATNPLPSWEPLTDFQPSLATGVLAMDPTNPLVLAAGTGDYSNFFGTTKFGGFGYVYVTNDGGDNWTAIADPAVRDHLLSTIHVLGNRIIVAGFGARILRRDTAGGAFAASDTGIPANYGNVYTIVADRSTSGVSRFYAAVQNRGIYRSEDDGRTWTLASNGPLQQAITNPALDWISLGMGKQGRLAVLVATAAEVAWVGFTDDRGANWTPMDVPRFPFGTPAAPNGPFPIQSFSGASGSALVITTAGPHQLPLALGAFRLRVNIKGVIGNPISTGSINGDWVPQPVLDPTDTNPDNTKRRILPNQFSLLDPITGSAALSNGTAASGGTWQQWVGLHRNGQSGNQAIAVDPSNPNLIYLGGDAQVDWLGGPITDGPGAPNSNFTGFTVMLRGNTTGVRSVDLPSPQWNAAAAGGTSHGTSPHADTRAFAFDVQGSLLLVNDGGIYRRTTPQTTSGDWQSLNNGLATTEQHDIAVDPATGLVASGNQDNGVTSQRPGLFAGWQTVFPFGDGGDVHFALRRDTGVSERYDSAQNLACLSMQTLAGGFDFGNFVAPTLCSGGPCSVRCNQPASTFTGTSIYEADGPPFLSRFQISQAALDATPTAPDQIVIAGTKAVYESLDGGSNVTALGGPLAVDLAYGNAVNPSALWAVTQGVAGGPGPGVWRRLTPGGAFTQATTPPELAPETFLNGGVVMDPNQPAQAYVVASNRVFSTSDGGSTWRDITGDLIPTSCGTTQPSRTGRIYSIAFVPSPSTEDRLFIGAENGVFMTVGAEPTIWTFAGPNMPNAPVIDLAYDAARDRLSAGTLGRGAWQLDNASKINRPPLAICRDQFAIADANCRATIPASQLNGGSIDPEGDAALIFTASPGSPYGLGNHCTTLTVNDGHGALGTCDANVIVADTTAPVLTQPAPATFVLCDPNGESVTLPVPTATDNCAATPTITGAVISSTDPTLTLPLALNGGTVVLGSGTHTIRWTATDGVNSSFVDQTVTTRPAIYATQSLDLRDRAVARLPDSTGATIMNSGTGATHVGITAKTGDIWSRGAVTVDDRATVSGFIRSASTVHVGNQVSLVGPTVQNTPITFPPTIDVTTTFPTSQGDVFVNSGSRPLTPGSYGQVRVASNATLALANGQYWFGSLDLEPQSRMTVSQSTAKVRVNVRTSIVMRGDVSVTPSAVGFLLAYQGTTAAALERPFTGVFASPSAALTLGATTFQTFTGQFYARSIVVQSDETVVCRKDF
ncbi:MAG TPA: hypothetical protein VN903_35615 [Polyangia bacterium]|jgi:photosystem II stability/assembly factor-like uncharacterized protein|nr:hypothetical protein [Polyangia bacterium]